MELIFATTNQGKILEINEIIALKEYKNVTVRGLPQKLPEPEENGTTYKQNAEIKFLYYEKNANISQNEILFAEDSGIEIAGLQEGVVGVNSAPFMRGFESQEKCFLELKCMLQEIHGNAENVAAYFFCNICTKLDGKILHFEGKIEGNITFENIADEGFGFDPIFIPKNFQKTFAKMKSACKNEISHRAIAFDKFMKYTQNV